MKKFLLTRLLAGSILTSLSSIVFAATPISPPNVPLESGSSIGTKPNVMFVLDDSGSMAWDHLGDEINDKMCKSINTNTNVITNFARSCVNDNNGNYFQMSATSMWEGVYAPDAPFFSYEFNKIYYNPSVTYAPGVNYQGNNMPDQTLASARTNIYQTQNVVNISTGLLEAYYCTKANPSAAEINNSSVCRRNGVDTPNPFNYHTEGLPNATYKYPLRGTFTPSYIQIIPTEWCDSNFVNCSLTAAGGIPAPVRWCKSSATAVATTLQSGVFPAGNGSNTGKNICQKNYDSSSGYVYPRYGKMKRVNITAAEATNYANWYTYYRNRMLAMKTSVGLSFKSIDATKRVGFITINPGSPVSTSKFLPITDFNIAQKQKFYNILYSTSPSGGTPLREALSRVGRYYAGKTDGLNSGMITGTNIDPVQYSCQQNFTILSTDGYWNGNAGVTLEGGSIGNVDNVNSGFSARSNGAYDGGLAGSSNTLSDVAMYYYNTDLRPSGSTGAGGVDVSDNNVPISTLDSNPSQHMVTYAISLGLNGFIAYNKDYYKGNSPEFENIKAGASGVCSWTSGVCDWPVPVADTLTAIDDLWHAAVNSRGRYYSAQNTQDIVEGLQDALNSLIAQTAASASAATSSPNITSTDNFLFYTTYRTSKWDGEIAAKTIDPNTGTISANPLWSARAALSTKISANSDTRTIYYMKNSSGSSLLTNFQYATLTSTEKAYFQNKCTTLTLNQCNGLTSSQKTDVDTGDKMVNYLRGQTAFEIQNNVSNPYFRNRDYVLGDIVDTSPVYVGTSNYAWSDAGYSAYAGTTASRTPMLYAGANDGMIHALDATTGQEKWAVIPKQLMPKLYKLADSTYATNHEFYVDGPLAVMDAKIGSNWKSILITGMGPGGTGYVALDVTNPNSPVALWEFCKDANLCSVTDFDLGYTYGNPVITKRAYDSRWVAYLPAGYDNQSGKGLIYEVDVGTGAILRKLYTGTGTAASPAGIAKINTFYDYFNQDNKAKFIYAGDLDGNIWKWDLTNASATTATLLGTAKDANGNVQPITAKIELGQIGTIPVLFVGTGKYLNFSDYNTNGIQSVYAIKDSGTNYGNLRANPGIIQQVLAVSGITSTTTSNSVNWTNDIGWYFDLKSQTGERVNIDPVLALGTLNIISNVPAATTCTAGGNAWNYQLDFLTGGAVPGNSSIAGRKLAGGFVVGQVVVRLDGSGGLKNFITDASGAVTPVGVQLNMGAMSNQKTSWREIYKR